MESIRPLTTSSERLASSALDRFMPEPKNRLGANFQGILSSTLSALSSAGPAVIPGLDGSYVQLLNKQIEAQQQMQLVSMESNIEKSKHETQMAAIRNVRVG